MRRLVIAVVGLLLVAGCGSDGGSKPAPGPDPFIDGGRTAFEAFVKKQRGHPVVVNKWASWCGPCRAEFPYFRDQARKRGKSVVFIGVNSNDNDGDARDFLADNPVPYRHFADPKLEVAAAFNGVQAFPTTAFYDKKGELAFVHQGGYQSEDQLVEDIDRYAR
ncbi:MAG: cytochrome c biosis protein CcmG, thiol:disulfide interchange protein DsbE [Thermoleophilaceae bacterium]|nr:cytochrome c biosis protein CcmG, thiol:disulfide interchange protein DsbE [Thermoleophilaceae bacterium]